MVSSCVGGQIITHEQREHVNVRVAGHEAVGDDDAESLDQGHAAGAIVVGTRGATAGRVLRVDAVLVGAQDDQGQGRLAAGEAGNQAPLRIAGETGKAETPDTAPNNERVSTIGGERRPVSASPDLREVGVDELLDGDVAAVGGEVADDAVQPVGRFGAGGALPRPARHIATRPRAFNDGAAVSTEQGLVVRRVGPAGADARGCTV